MLIELQNLDERPLPREATDINTVVVDRFADRKKDYRTREISQSLFPVHIDAPGDVFHAGFLGCLELAWGSHYGVAISPDVVWYDLLCEVTSVVKEHPEAYRGIFTTSPDKQEIVVQSDSFCVIPMDKVVAQLRASTPVNPDLFLPEFSTTTSRARHARYAAFADAASPFYNYFMFCCGIPFVEVLGTKGDWERLRDAWRKLGDLFPAQAAFFLHALSVIDRTVNGLDTPDHWREMFYLERCGSGSQVEAKGWYTDLFREKPPVQYVKNFSPHASTVDYRHLQTKKNYRMVQGILGSVVDGRTLRPEFGAVVYEKTEPVVTKMPEPNFSFMRG